MFKTNFSGHNKIWGGSAPECLDVATRVAKMTDGYVVLIIVLQLQTRRQLTPATKIQNLASGPAFSR